MMLLIDRRGTTLRYRDGRIFIDHSEQKTRSVPVNALANLIVYGNLNLPSALLRALATQAVACVCLPTRGHTEAAWVGAQPKGNIEARIAQYGCYLDPPLRLKQAHHIVTSKITAQSEHLQAHGLAVPKALKPILQHHSERPELMGHEGAAAAAYFSSLSTLINPHWHFTHRNRRPPKDPVNALLSLSYTLLGAQMRLAIISTGLDPALGFLHDTYPNRDALVLDLIEDQRPIIDRWVLSLLDQHLTPIHFHSHADTGCRLNKEARGIYYAAWSNQQQDWHHRPDAPMSLAAICRHKAIALRHSLMSPKKTP